MMVGGQGATAFRCPILDPGGASGETAIVEAIGSAGGVKRLRKTLMCEIMIAAIMGYRHSQIISVSCWQQRSTVVEKIMR
jgi:hypothetical protein